MRDARFTAHAKIPYTIVRSRRKTLGIAVTRDGTVEVRIPRWVTLAAAEAFANEKEAWIAKNREKMLTRAAQQAERRWDELREETYPWIRGRGGELFRRKAAFWADRMGVRYQRITIKDMSTRWGSCSTKGNINFCWKVFVLPEHLTDYIIVHELAHLRQMNHSPAFWELVAVQIPDYRVCRKRLNEYG